MRRKVGAARSPFQTIRVIAETARDKWWAVPALVVLGLLTALTEGIGIGILIPLLTAMFGTADQADTLASIVGRVGQGLDENGRVFLLAGVVLALGLLRAATQFAYEALSNWLSGQIVHRLHLLLFRQLLDVGFAFFAGKETGALFEVVRGKTWLVSDFVTLVSKALISLCAIAVFGVLLVLISPILTLGAAIGAITVALLTHLVTRRMRRIGGEAVSAGAALSSRVIEALASMRVIRLFNQEDREHARLAAASERDRVSARELGLMAAAILPWTELAYIPLFLTILLVAWKAGLAFPTLIAFLVLLYRLQPHARRIDQIRVEIAGMLPLVEEVAGLLRREGKPYLASGSMPYRGLQHGISYANVGFCYGAERGGNISAVTDLTFQIEKNRVTALVGESGAGKSTVLSLLFRLYDPTAGAILVDGVPLSELDLAGWRRRMTFAGQDAELIGDTVFEAVAYGRPEADRASVEEAARRANAAEFILRLPLGYDTPIGDRGSQLSAGQRQRLGLARALLCDPEILVLDEATSALDSVSESLIQEAIAQLAGKLTVVIVAHRLSTIRNADRIVVLRAGAIIEQGRPQELLQRPDGHLTRLWQVQTEAFVPSESRRLTAPAATSQQLGSPP